MLLQNEYNLERYIKCKYDENIPFRTVYPYTKTVTLMTDAIEPFPGDNVISKLMNIVSKRHFNKEPFSSRDLKKYCFIEVDVNLELVDKEGWYNDKYYGKYSSRTDNFKQNKSYYPVVFWKYGEKMYSLDGMHRIMGALEAGWSKINSVIMVERTDLHKWISDVELKRIYDKANKCTWFPHYQEIREIALHGTRRQVPRYTDIYKFDILKNKKVLDLGCNIGQAVLEAYFHGAHEVFGFDFQVEAIDAANEIVKVLGIEDTIKYDTVDFNNWKTMDKVKQLGSFDWIIFQAVYRTKEIDDIHPVMDYIYDNVREGVIFEGHADPLIDTPDYYKLHVFDKYNYKAEYLGKSDNRPAWILRK